MAGRDNVRTIAFAQPSMSFSSIFLVNPSLSSTSQIKRVGSCWLWKRCFGVSQGQLWGQVHGTMNVPVVHRMVSTEQPIHQIPAPIHAAKCCGVYEE